MSKTQQHKYSMNDYALNRLKLRPLVIFERVLQSHSIVHAAEQLHLSPLSVAFKKRAGIIWSVSTFSIGSGTYVDVSV